MGVPKLSADVETVADALNLVKQYEAWLNADADSDVPHPGHDSMANAAAKLAEELLWLKRDVQTRLDLLAREYALCTRDRQFTVMCQAFEMEALNLRYELAVSVPPCFKPEHGGLEWDRAEWPGVSK